MSIDEYCAQVQTMRARIDEVIRAIDESVSLGTPSAVFIATHRSHVTVVCAEAFKLFTDRRMEDNADSAKMREAVDALMEQVNLLAEKTDLLV